VKLVWLMKEENRMDNFLSFVYHAEENRIHSAVLYSGRLMTEADVQYAKKDILNPHHMNDFFP